MNEALENEKHLNLEKIDDLQVSNIDLLQQIKEAD